MRLKRRQWGTAPYMALNLAELAASGRPPTLYRPAYAGPQTHGTTQQPPSPPCRRYTGLAHSVSKRLQPVAWTAKFISSSELLSLQVRICSQAQLFIRKARKSRVAATAFRFFVYLGSQRLRFARAGIVRRYVK